jgi:hypothetical protein
MAVTRVTTDNEGNMSEQDMPSNKQYATSEDYKEGGVTAFTGPAKSRTQVHSPDGLADNDLVEVDGMQIRVADARSMGLLGDLFANAPKSATEAQAAKDHKAAQEVTTQKSDTGHAEYDASVDNLNAMLEEGTIMMEEAQEYDHAHGELAMIGVSPDDAWATLHNLAEGEVAEADVDPQQRQAIQQAYQKVQEAAAKSALNEIGDEGVSELRTIADLHPGAQQAIWRYASDRAQGLTNVTWDELRGSLKEQLGMR